MAKFQIFSASSAYTVEFWTEFLSFLFFLSAFSLTLEQPEGEYVFFFYSILFTVFINYFIFKLFSSF